MKIKIVILSIIIYVITIFPITALWHVGFFQELYLEFGYFNQEETFLAGVSGLINIFVQGFILAILYSKTQFHGSHIMQGVKFSGLIFVFYFSIQVINFVVRKEINDMPFFILMEFIYMLIQFSIYGVLMGVLYRKFDVKPHSA